MARIRGCRQCGENRGDIKWTYRREKSRQSDTSRFYQLTNLPRSLMSHSSGGDESVAVILTRKNRAAGIGRVIPLGLDCQRRCVVQQQAALAIRRDRSVAPDLR